MASAKHGSIPEEEEEDAEEIIEEPYYEDYAVKEPPLVTQLATELLGTFILVQVGCGAECVALYIDRSFGNSNVVFLWVLAATLGIYISATVSGGHINPAVTLSFALVRPSAFSIKKVVPYWIAQILGGVLAGLINLLLFYHAIEKYEQTFLDKKSSRRAAVANNLPRFSNVLDFFQTKDFGIDKKSMLLKSASGFGNYWSLSDAVVDQYHACFIEAFGTAFLVFIIFMVTSPTYTVPGPAVPPIVALAVGSMVALLGPLTGGCINPARDLGPRLITLVTHWGAESMTDWLPYVLGPLVGGPIGALLAESIINMTL